MKMLMNFNIKFFILFLSQEIKKNLTLSKKWWIRLKERSASIGLAGFSHCKKETDKLLCCMWDGNIIMFAFLKLLLKISRESNIPNTNVSCSIKQSVSEIPGSTFFHMSLIGIKLAWLISGRRKTAPVLTGMYTLKRTVTRSP